MPSPLLVPAITAGAGLVSQGINAMSQGSMNKKTRRHQIYMYDRQRADALSDWNMQNAYNTPAAQMARLKEAGLNPNLVYGNGAATSEAGAVRSSDTGNWNPQAPQFDLGGVANNSLAAYYDTQIKQQQLSNLEAENVYKMVLTAAAALGMGLTEAKTNTEKTKNQQGQFDLSLSQDLRATTLEFKRATVQKILAEIQRTSVQTKTALDENERRAALNASNIKEAAERILSMRIMRAKTQDERNNLQEQLKQLKLDTNLKEYEKKLRDQGIVPGSPWWWKTVGDAVDSTTFNADDAQQSWKDRNFKRWMQKNNFKPQSGAGGKW